ncbi:MAG: peptide MFS transporter [Rhabdochlamydiaceae bacterium]|nr:peptide MFS transporter [Rhabdochlamydiaceae bacterium]
MARSTGSSAHPKEMYLLALTEMCQRFAFWGIANLLVLYLVQNQKFTDTAADTLFGLFTGVAFVLPVVGGYFSDKFNYRLPVIWGILLTAAGCFLFSTGSLPLIYISLALVALGAAVFTPSIYALLGSLYHHQHHLRDGGFSIYYSAVNIGAFVAMVSLGALGQAKHWHFAFFLAGVVQLFALVFFKWALQNPDLLEASKIREKLKGKKQAPLHRHEWSRILVICILSFFSILFWMAYNQGGSSLNLFALRFTDRSVFGMEIPPVWLLSSETLYLILFAMPLSLLYVYLTKKKMNPTPIVKSALSLTSMGICFLIMVIASWHIPSGAHSGSVSPFYLLFAYAFMALGEMLIAPIGLSLITHLSPHRFTALLVGVWYLCIGIAFYLGGIIAPWMSKLKEMSQFFNLFVIASFVSAALLFLVAKKLDKMRHLKTL